MTLIDLYKEVLSTALMHADEEGFINRPTSFTEDKKQEPVLIDGKRLVLPTTEQLAHVDVDNKIIFHPLNENALNGESKVVAKLRTAIAVNLNMASFGLITGLIKLGIGKADHSKLSPEQSKVLSILKDVDDKSLVDLTKIFLNGAKTHSMEGLIFKIYLKRGGTVLGKKYSRVGVVSTPLYEELCKEEDEVYGIKLRKKDRGVLRKLFEFIFPSIEESHGYDQGSDSDIAPYLDALMQTAFSVGVDINAKLEDYKEFIANAEDMMIPLAWQPEFERLDTYIPQIRRIPVDEANAGTAKVQEQMMAPNNVASNVEAVNAQRAPEAVAAPAPAPSMAPAANTIPASSVLPSSNWTPSAPVVPQFSNMTPAPTGFPSMGAFNNTNPGKVSIDSILGYSTVNFGQMSTAGYNAGYGNVPVNPNSIL